MTIRTSLALISLISLLGCASGTPAVQSHGISPADVSGPQSFGAADNVMHLKHIYVSKQPDEQGFVEAAQEGVTVVINTRLPDEIDWDERAAVESAGMVYYNIPMSKKGDSLDAATMHRITKLVEQHRDEQILMHCGSGNRISAWLATHLVEDHGMDTQSAIGIARQMGLTKSGLEKRVRTYLDEAASSNATLK